MAHGETRNVFRLAKFGGLVTDIPEQALSGESPDLSNVRIILGNTAVRHRGGSEIVRHDINYTDSSRTGVYYTVWKEKNPKGPGWIVGFQEQPSKEIVLLFYWDNDYPPFDDEAAIVYFAEGVGATLPPQVGQYPVLDSTGAANANKLVKIDWDNWTTTEQDWTAPWSYATGADNQKYCADTSGNIWFFDGYFHYYQKLEPDGTVTTSTTMQAKPSTPPGYPDANCRWNARCGVMTNAGLWIVPNYDLTTYTEPITVVNLSTNAYTTWFAWEPSVVGYGASTMTIIQSGNYGAKAVWLYRYDSGIGLMCFDATGSHQWSVAYANTIKTETGDSGATLFCQNTNYSQIVVDSDSKGYVIVNTYEYVSPTEIYTKYYVMKFDATDGSFDSMSAKILNPNETETASEKGWGYHMEVYGNYVWVYDYARTVTILNKSDMSLYRQITITELTDASNSDFMVDPKSRPCLCAIDSSGRFHIFWAKGGTHASPAYAQWYRVSSDGSYSSKNRTCSEDYSFLNEQYCSEHASAAQNRAPFGHSHTGNFINL